MCSVEKPILLLLIFSMSCFAQPALQNGDFEGNAGPFQTAAAWTSFGSAKFEGARLIDHGWTQQIGDLGILGTAGLYQRVTGVAIGAVVEVAAELSCEATVLQAAVGIDPAGGTDPSVAQWSTASSASSWTSRTIAVIAANSTVTVFLWAYNADAFQVRFEKVSFDNVALTAAGATVTPGLPSATPTGTSSAPTSTPTLPAGTNPTPYVWTGTVFGSTFVLGESIVSPGWQHDDLGPPIDKIVQVYNDSASTCLSVGFSDWRRMEPNDPGSGPSTYNWRLLEDSLDPFVPVLPGRMGVVYASFLDPTWLQGQYNTSRYWTLAERFMEAFARQVNRRGIYHFVFENEPNGLARGDWPDYYMNRLRHAYAAIKRADTRNQVIAGNLSERAAAAGHFDLLYDRGLKDYSDVIGHHPYTDNQTTAVDIDDIKVLRQKMVARGDGNKKIFLGEGWGPKRVVPGISRSSAADRPTRAEINVLNNFMVNGYRRLTTAQSGYDPNWILGALFFTYNDNLGSLHWADRATPVPNGCLIDGYLISPCNTTPGHHNGGLVDLYGNAKRDLIWRFPSGGFRASPTPVPNPPAQGGNLLQNGSFEGGFSSGRANGWSSFATTSGGVWEQRAGRTGLAQAFGEDNQAFGGGIRQTVATTAGQWYGIRAWLRYDESGAGPNTFVTVGWDPTGQTGNPRALSMTWSFDYADADWGAGTWHKVEHIFKATGAQASIWFWGGVEYSPPTWFMLVDDVEVYPVLDPHATPTPTATPTLPGPDSDGDALQDALEPVVPGPGQTNRWLPDSDGDGLGDASEDSNRNGQRDTGETSARAADSDGDLLEDGVELGVTFTDPLDGGAPGVLPDQDQDHLPDWLDPAPQLRDADEDHFGDGYETGQLGLAAMQNAAQMPSLGDVNSDTRISNVDALAVQALFLGVANPETLAIGRADANRDGAISNVDALMLQGVFLELVAVLGL